MPSTTSVDERIIQAIRAWLKAAAARGGLTDAQVVVADDKGPRPPKPYLTVNVTTLGSAIGVDERADRLADTIVIGNGAAGAVYAITVGGTAISYTRLADDTNSTVAAAIVDLINAVDHHFAEASGATITASTAHGDLAIITADAVPVVTFLGQRRASVSVQGFGSETSEWLERAAMRLQIPSVQTALDAAGLSVLTRGGITDVARLLDTEIEPRFLREFEVFYALRTDPASVTPLEQVVTTVTLEDVEDDPDPYTVTIEDDLT